MKSTLRKALFFGLIFLISQTSHAFTNLDGIKDGLSEADDQEKVDLLLDIADSLSNTSPIQAKKYFNTAISLARILSDKAALSKALSWQSEYEYLKGNYQQSLECDREIYALSVELNDSSGIANSLMGMANCYGDLGIYSQSIDHYIQAKKIVEDINDTTTLAYINLNLGATYAELEQPELALTHYLNAKDYFEQLNYDEELADVLQNIGNYYSDNEDIPTSLDYYRRALQLYKKEEAFYGMALCLANFGYTFMDIDSLEQANELFDKSIELSSSLEDKSTLVYALNLKGDLLTRQGKFKKAKITLDKAHNIAINEGFREDLQSNHEILSEYYHALGITNKAYENLIRATEIKDSLLTESRMSDLNSQMLAYETEKRDQHIKRLEAEMVEEELEKTRQQLVLIGISVLSILLLITAIVIFIAYRKKESSENQLELNKKELEEINLKLEEEKFIAQKATRSKSEFLSTMTHELRTPLNAVIGISNMLEEEKNEKKRKEALQTLKFASNNLLSLINDILDFNKLETGNVELEEVSFNLTTLLQNIRMSFQVQASQKNIRFTVHRSGNVPEMVMGDPTRLTQVLSNLVSNAIKFTEQGFVRLYAEVVHEKSREARIRFIVKDTGIGIPQEKHSLIFDSFQQADQSTSRKFGGSGLGLAISKKIIELSGGQLKLESQQGLGATFMFELPFKLVQDKSSDVLRETTVEELEIMKAQLKYRRVLLVDDNEMNLFVARNILQSMEIDALEASSGYEAIELFEDRSDFSLVLLDLQMPGIDGYDTAKAIRSMDARIPIIALTASSKEEVNMTSSGFHFNGFIRKPFEIDQLIQTMHKSSGLTINHEEKKPSPPPQL